MLHVKNNIAASLVLIAFITGTAYAAGETPAATSQESAAKPAPKKAPKKRVKAAPAPAKTEAAPNPVTTTPLSDAAAQPKSDAAPQAAATTATDTAAASSVAATPVVAVTPPAAETPPATGKASAKKAMIVKAEEDTAEAIKQRSGPGDPISGKDKSELCQGCHGEEGISAEPTAPKLAGQYGPYISKQLRNFQEGIRTHQIMSDIAKTINDDDLNDISAYFASRTKMKGNGSDNQLGKELFLHGDMSRMMVACVNCHGVNGKGKTPINSVFPVIGGQHKDYLRVQLINFRAGDRSNSPGGVMNIITQKLTDAELEALADYVSGL